MDLTVHSKVRGTKTQPNLAERHPDNNKISRQSLCILSATAVSVDGVQTAPIQLGVKALHSRQVFGKVQL